MQKRKTSLPPTVDKDILFYSHLGLGDNISCNGIAHYLANKYNKNVFVVSKNKNLENVKFLYKDFPNINVIPVTDDSGGEQQAVQQVAAERNLHLIHTFIASMKDPWDLDFYNMLSIDYEVKFNSSRLPVIDNEHEIISNIYKKYNLRPGENFAFIHQDESRGLTFQYKTNLPVVFNQLDLNVFEMSIVLKLASELHMMGSSLICIAELMKLPKEHQRAYYYDIRSGVININNKQNWIKI